MLLTIIVFILILSVLVLIHEAGHYFVAKMVNIKVEEFGFGFPPRVFGKKIGETLYSINALPIGGFVKLYGEDEAGAGRLNFKPSKFKNVSRAFFARNPWQRALVVVAGVIMNFLLSVVILSVLLALVGIQIPNNKVTIHKVLTNSPAQTSGLKPGDLLIAVDNVKITSTEQVLAETQKHLGQKVDLKIQRGKSEKNIFLTPRSKYPKDEGPMGIEIEQGYEQKKYSWYQAPIEGTKQALQTSWMIIAAFGMVINQLFTQGTVPQGVAGPVGIAQLTGQVVQVGPVAVLLLVSALSLNLAIINVLPIPALDGGRLFFILIEAIFRKRVHPKFESYAHAIGMALLLALIALITIHDIARVISGQPLIPR